MKRPNYKQWKADSFTNSGNFVDMLNKHCPKPQNIDEFKAISKAIFGVSMTFRSFHLDTTASTDYWSEKPAHQGSMEIEQSYDYVCPNDYRYNHDCCFVSFALGSPNTGGVARSRYGSFCVPPSDYERVSKLNEPGPIRKEVLKFCAKFPTMKPPKPKEYKPEPSPEELTIKKLRKQLRELKKQLTANTKPSTKNP